MGKGAGAFATIEMRVPKPTFGLWFLGMRPIDANGEARRAEPTSPSLAAYDQKRLSVLPREPIRHAVADYPSFSHSVTANRITTLLYPYSVRNCSKLIKMVDFSKTGSINMAETRAISF